MIDLGAVYPPIPLSFPLSLSLFRFGRVDISSMNVSGELKELFEYPFPFSLLLSFFISYLSIFSFISFRESERERERERGREREGEGEREK